MARLPIPFSNPATYAGHSGVDFPQPRGTVFRASGPGRVTTRSRNERGGFYIWVQYDNGPLVGYHHMDSHNGCPNVNDRVSEGSQLGFVGNTGNSTGPHLHSEVANHATTAGYWQFFDPSRVVGGGSTAGGSPSGGGQWSDTKKQQFLTSIGLDTGGVGNGWGPASDAATRSFQNSVGLPVDGVFGPNTTSVAQVIEAGGNRTGRSVQEIQSKVGTDADGQWGPKTSLAVYRWQKANGLDADALWGNASDAKAFPPVIQPPAGGAPAFPLAGNQWFGPEQGGDQSISGWYSHNGDLKQWQQRMIERGWDLGPDGADGYYGPKGQVNPADSYTGRTVIQFQTEKGLDIDGKIGPSTWSAAWTAPVTPPVTPPTTPDPVPPTTDDEAAATPDIKTPTAADFPAWIRYEEKFDQQMSADPLWNANLQKHYGKPYQPIESHTHWWGEPGKSGTHDGNVQYLNSTKDVGPNYVVSAGRITLTCPLNKNAVTTGQRNPYAWKTENDPLITTSVSNHGYKTLGFLHYLVEKLNPSLLNEPIRLHKEFYATSCSNIDVAKVREYAEAFRSGLLDPATGEAPVVDPGPEPEPEPDAAKDEIYDLLEEVARKVEAL